METMKCPSKRNFGGTFCVIRECCKCGNTQVKREGLRDIAVEVADHDTVAVRIIRSVVFVISLAYA